MNDNDFSIRTWPAYAGDGKGNLHEKGHEDLQKYFFVRYPDRDSPPVEVFSPIPLSDNQEVMIGYLKPNLLQVISVKE